MRTRPVCRVRRLTAAATKRLESVAAGVSRRIDQAGLSRSAALRRRLPRDWNP